MLPLTSPPAGGATAGQMIIGTAASALISGGLLALGTRHRSGRTAALTAMARPVRALTGLPPWAALPLALAGAAFAISGFGFVWDVALHIDNGRDRGPFGTPAHFFMLAGLFGLLGAGWFAIAMADERHRSASWLRIAHDWHAPAGGIVMLACAGVALLGFPLDDLWHRLFGQDVTLWGPTHQLMICGGLFSLAGLLMLLREARVAKAARDGRPLGPPRRSPVAIVHAAVLLTGLTIAWQQEFAYGIPQFRLLFQPVLIVLSGTVVLVATRLLYGRGAALLTALTAAGVMGTLTLLVGPLAGQATHHFPLYLAEALLVEIAIALAAWRSSLRAGRSAAAAGALAGALVATGGVAAEYAWSHVWMPIPWPAHVLGEGMLRALPVGVAAGIIAAWIAAALGAGGIPSTGAGAAAQAPVAGAAWARRAPLAGFAVILASLAALLPTSAPPAHAGLTVATVHGGPLRTVVPTLRVDPPSAAAHPDWFIAFAWQGKENRRVLSPLREIAPGTWRASGPLPVYGTWKTVIRLARGAAMESIPVYLPADRAIPAAGVPVPSGAVTRSFAADRTLLQRERRRDVPGWLFAAASSVVAFLVIVLLGLLAFSLQRVTGASGPFAWGQESSGLAGSAAKPAAALSAR